MRTADNLTTLMCADCLEILGASTSWNPKGLFKPVKGLIYLYLILVFYYVLFLFHFILLIYFVDEHSRCNITVL